MDIGWNSSFLCLHRNSFSDLAFAPAVLRVLQNPIGMPHCIYWPCILRLLWILVSSQTFFALDSFGNLLARHFEGNISQFAFVFLVIRLWLWVLGKSPEIIESAQSCSPSVLHLVKAREHDIILTEHSKSTFIIWPRWYLLGFPAVSYSSFPLS